MAAEFLIMRRRRVFVCTDPQRRCYNGHIDGHHTWGPWEVFDRAADKETIERRLAFWRDLAAYAARERRTAVETEYEVRESDPLAC